MVGRWSVVGFLLGFDFVIIVIYIIGKDYKLSDVDEFLEMFILKLLVDLVVFSDDFIFVVGFFDFNEY